MRHEPQPSPLPSDKWLLWPTVATVLAVALLSLLCGWPGLLSLILIPLSMLGSLVAAASLLVSACVLGVRRRLRKAASMLLALVVPVALVLPINWATQCLHLAATIWLGIGQLGHGPSPDDRKFAVYDWSVGLAGGPGTFLLHDPTDEIALPLRQHKQPPSPDNGLEDECVGRVNHLLGHYYVCVTDWSNAQ